MLIPLPESSVITPAINFSVSDLPLVTGLPLFIGSAQYYDAAAVQLSGIVGKNTNTDEGIDDFVIDSGKPK